MKRFLYAIGGLNVVWLFVSLGGVAFAGQLDFWTWNLMGSLLAMVVLAPLLVFIDSGLGSRSGSASPPSTSAQPSAEESSSAETDASGAEAFAPARQTEPAGSREPAPSSAASSAAPSPTVDAPPADTTEKQTRSSDAASPASSPSSPTTSTSSSEGWASQLLFYAGSALLLLWIGTSVTGLFVDRSNLTFWTWSVMWALLATVLWAPIVVFALDPFNRPSPPRAQSSTQKSTPGEASSTAAAPQESTPGDSAEPFVLPDAAPDFQDVDAQNADTQNIDTQEADAASSASADESSEPRRSSESPSDPPSLSARTNPRSTEDWNPWSPEEDAQE